MYKNSYLLKLFSIIILAIALISCAGRNGRGSYYQPTLASNNPEPVDADIDLPIHPPTVGPGSYRRVKPVVNEQHISKRESSRNSRLDEYDKARQIPCQNSVAQEWSVDSLSTKWTRMVNRRNRKCLDIMKGGTRGRDYQVPAGLLRCQNSGWQFWRFINAGNGYVKIQNKAHGDCLDLQVGGAEGRKAGVAIVKNNCVKSSWQDWEPIPFGRGVYKFKNKVSGMCLDY